MICSALYCMVLVWAFTSEIDFFFRLTQNLPNFSTNRKTCYIKKSNDTDFVSSCFTQGFCGWHSLFRILHRDLLVTHIFVSRFTHVTGFLWPTHIFFFVFYTGYLWLTLWTFLSGRMMNLTNTASNTKGRNTRDIGRGAPPSTELWT
jgi:hypothetical protein